MRTRFEERLVAAGGQLMTPSELDSLLAGRLFVSDHPICAPWRSRATCSEPAEAEVAITGAEALVAETGSVMLVSGPVECRLCTSLPLVHVVLGTENQLVADMETAFERVADRLKPGSAAANVTFITGPSRTADIEKILITGAHGPKKLVFVFVGRDS